MVDFVVNIVVDVLLGSVLLKFVSGELVVSSGFVVCDTKSVEVVDLLPPAVLLRVAVLPLLPRAKQ